MTNYKIHNLKLILGDKIFLILGIIAGSTLLFYAFGCQPKTPSIINPDRKVTVGELQIEIDSLMTLSELRFADLRKQQEIKQFVFNQAIAIGQTGEVNPIGILTSLLAVLGMGATADDIRLRKQRKLTTTKIGE